MIPQLADRHYHVGSGFLSADRYFFLINIPKNASSFLTDLLPRQGWSAAEYNDPTISWHDVKEVVAVLRHPMQRWISGIAQYLHTYILHPHGFNDAAQIDFGESLQGSPISAAEFINNYNGLVERLIFDNAVRLDDHVWPQSEIIDMVLPDLPRRYIYMGENFEQDLENVLNIKIQVGLDKNRGDSNQDIKLLQDFFREKISIRPDLSVKLMYAYRKDYALINREFGDKQ